MLPLCPVWIFLLNPLRTLLSQNPTDEYVCPPEKIGHSNPNLLVGMKFRLNVWTEISMNFFQNTFYKTY